MQTVLAVLCAFLALRVKVNYDMTRYLPDDSAMKKGMDIMEAEFPSMGADKSIRVMADGLTGEEEAELEKAGKAEENNDPEILDFPIR